MQSRFLTVTADQVRAIELSHDPIARLSRKDLLTIQATKLINYFREDLDPEWGGGSHEIDDPKAQSAVRRILHWSGADSDAQASQWLCKKRASLPWGPQNVELQQQPCRELGYPYEPYLSVNGAILTLNQASRILSIDRMRLVQLKCSLLLDGSIVKYAIKEMLKPRPLWPKIKLKRGGKGRSYRFAD